MNDAPSLNPPRWLRGWRLLVIIGVTAMLLVVMALATLVMLSGDLRPIIARAKRDGLPTSWRDLGIASNPGHAATLQQVEVLLAATRAYSSTQIKFHGRYYTRGTPGVPLGEGFYQHVAKRPDAKREQIRTLLASCHEPFRPYDDPDIVQWTRFWMLSGLHDLASEEFLAAAQPNAGQAQALLLFCECCAPDSVYHLMIRVRLLQNAAKAMRFHLDALRLDPQTVPSQLRKAASDLDGMLAVAVRAEFVRTIIALQIDPKQYANDIGLALPKVMRNAIARNLIQRLGRAPLLEQERKWALAVGACSDPRGPDPKAFFASPGSSSFGSPSFKTPMQMLGDLYTDSFHTYWYDSYPKARLALLITAAALDDAPWPLDPYSSTGASVQALTDKDGVVLAVFSVGPDGVNNGGNGDDYVVPLRAPKDVATKKHIIPPPSP